MSARSQRTSTPPPGDSPPSKSPDPSPAPRRAAAKAAKKAADQPPASAAAVKAPRGKSATHRAAPPAPAFPPPLEPSTQAPEIAQSGNSSSDFSSTAELCSAESDHLLEPLSDVRNRASTPSPALALACSSPSEPAFPTPQIAKAEASTADPFPASTTDAASQEYLLDPLSDLQTKTAAPTPILAPVFSSPSESPFPAPQIGEVKAATPNSSPAVAIDTAPEGHLLDSFPDIQTKTAAPNPTPAPPFSSPSEPAFPPPQIEEVKAASSHSSIHLLDPLSGLQTKTAAPSPTLATPSPSPSEPSFPSPLVTEIDAATADAPSGAVASTVSEGHLLDRYSAPSFSPSPPARETALPGLLDRLAGGTPLALACHQEGGPGLHAAVREWMAEDPALVIALVQAQAAGFDRLALEALAIADEVTAQDTLATRTGAAPNKEWLARSKFRVDTRLKLLALWDPARYGERSSGSTLASATSLATPLANPFPPASHPFSSSAASCSKKDSAHPGNLSHPSSPAASYGIHRSHPSASATPSTSGPGSATPFPSSAPPFPGSGALSAPSFPGDAPFNAEPPLAPGEISATLRAEILARTTAAALIALTVTPPATFHGEEE